MPACVRKLQGAVCAILFLSMMIGGYSAAAPFGALPLHFEELRGQGEDATVFSAQGANHALLLTSETTALTLRKAESDPPVTLRMQLNGANPRAAITGENLLPGVSHYFKGRDRTQWRTAVPHFAQVRRQDVYPGVDLLFYGAPQRLEYDFVIAPAANPEEIRMSFTLDGMEKGNSAPAFPTMDANGNLVFSTPAGDVRINRPVAYQELEGKRTEIAAAFSLTASGEVGFSIGTYDSGAPLTIDPVLVYGTYLGGADMDYAYDVVVDSAGNTYITGNTMSADFPVDEDAIQPEYAGGTGAGDVFVAKLNPSGTEFVFCTYLGGADNDGGVGIAIDPQRNVYVTGGADSADFPVTSGVWQNEKAGARDAFIAKLSTNGDALLYSTFLGGASSDCGVDIKADNDGNVYLAGWTNSEDFPVFENSLKPIFGGGNSDGFACKLSPNGNSLDYSTYLGGAGFDDARGIAADGDGNAYVTGYTSSRDMITTEGALQTGYRGGDYDAFLLKIDPFGSAYVYATYLGGDNSDSGRGIALDSAGNAYITGDTNSLNFPATIGSFQQSYAGGDRDAFVVKVNTTGSREEYGTFLGGGSTDYGYAIAVDALGNAYLTGYTFSTDFPVIVGTLQPAYGGSQDAFVAKISRYGNLLSFSTYLGGSLWEKGYGIGLDAANNLYVTGSTGSTDFPISAGAVQPLASGGISSAFVVRIATEAEGEGEAQSEGDADGEGWFEGEGLHVSLVGGATRTRNVGESVTFNVSVTGYTGTVNYGWWFKPAGASDFTPLTAPNSPVYTKYNLQVSDAGKYRCSVTDALGMVLSPSFTLTMIAPEGEGEGSADGEGQSEGVTEGEGLAEGSTEGGGEGAVDGEGVSEGSTDGEGANEGEGITEGQTEGTPEGEGNSEGEGTIEGEAPCNYSVSVGPVNIPILELGLTIATITINPFGAVRDVNVSLSIVHPMVDQLLAQIISPQGVESFLFLYPAHGGANITDALFDDDAATSFGEASAPYTGSFQPAIPLNIFNGNEMHGVWTLRLTDKATGGTGYLKSWGLHFNPCSLEGEGNGEGEGGGEGQPEAEGTADGEGEGEGGEPHIFHTADQDTDGRISLTELLRVIQLFNSGEFHCDPSGEDGYAPGPGDRTCARHDSDYLDPAWKVGLVELLRLIQFFNVRGYHRCATGEDDFCPGFAAK